MFDDTEDDGKFEGKLTCAFKWGIWQIRTGWNKWIAPLTKPFTHV